MPSDEIAVIMVWDDDPKCEDRDIVVSSKIEGLKRITTLHPKMMALQYPILFPRGEDGFRKGLKYVCGAEAAHPMFGFDIHHRSISVERLSFHLPNEKYVTFNNNNDLTNVCRRASYKNNKLEAFFKLCQNSPEARKYTYQEIPEHFVWDAGQCEWNLRKKGQKVGRLNSSHYSSGELWYLRMLLCRVKGPRCFRDLRTFEHQRLVQNLNYEQKRVYDAVLSKVDKNDGGFFFVYGSGGCGKTYLWNTIITKLRSEKKIVLPVASSGIAATLLPGGRTAHSRFKIPLKLDDESSCSIPHNSDIAELNKKTNLIIWDEAPMQNKLAFECLDRSLRDIMKSVSADRADKLFGVTNAYNNELIAKSKLTQKNLQLTNDPRPFLRTLAETKLPNSNSRSAYNQKIQFII